MLFLYSYISLIVIIEGFKTIYFKIINYVEYLIFFIIIVGIGDWGLGIGDWGLGPIPDPQSPIPQSPIP